MGTTLELIQELHDRRADLLTQEREQHARVEAGETEAQAGFDKIASEVTDLTQRIQNLTGQVESSAQGCALLAQPSRVPRLHLPDQHGCPVGEAGQQGRDRAKELPLPFFGTDAADDANPMQAGKVELPPRRVPRPRSKPLGVDAVADDLGGGPQRPGAVRGQRDACIRRARQPAFDIPWADVG